MNDPASLPTDPKWPRASEWLAGGTQAWQEDPSRIPDLGVLGVPAHQTSISPTRADATPGAVRHALARYSLWAETTGTDLRELLAVDLGDVDAPDGAAGEARTESVVAEWPGELLMALGGDNSVTYAVAKGLRATGLVTLDAHHDVRDGVSNGSPVQRLITDGVIDPRRIVQVGISDFANSPQYAQWVHEAGITVITRAEVERVGIGAAMRRALEIAAGEAGPGVGPLGGTASGARGASGSRGAAADDGLPRIHVDLDVDVCDRSVVPACPAAAPGGLSAWELRQAARLAGRDPNVVGIDCTEVDATQDAADQRTVRLVALCVLEAAAGVAERPVWEV